jgi:hypothetical protein
LALAHSVLQCSELSATQKMRLTSSFPRYHAHCNTIQTNCLHHILRATLPPFETFCIAYVPSFLPKLASSAEYGKVSRFELGDALHMYPPSRWRSSLCKPTAICPTWASAYFCIDFSALFQPTTFQDTHTEKHCELRIRQIPKLGTKFAI